MAKFFYRMMLLLLLNPACWASLRDPTHPEILAEHQGPAAQTWELQAIIISRGQRIAIFNGHPLRLGSELAGFKVVSIKPNTVHLEGPDGKMTLFLFNQIIKKASHRPI